MKVNMEKLQSELNVMEKELTELEKEGARLVKKLNTLKEKYQYYTSLRQNTIFGKEPKKTKKMVELTNKYGQSVYDQFKKLEYKDG